MSIRRRRRESVSLEGYIIRNIHIMLSIGKSFGVWNVSRKELTMSYCRFGTDSNVYLFPRLFGDYECCGCWLESKTGDMSSAEHVIMHSLEEVLAHLQKHRDADHLVPERTFVRVREEMKGVNDGMGRLISHGRAMKALEGGQYG